MVELTEVLAIPISIVFFVFFFIQKTVFTYANRMIFRLMPAVILPPLLIFGYITYRLEIKSLFERGAITMAIDSTAMAYTLLGIFVLSALIGCLSGIAYAKLKSSIFILLS